MRRFFFSMLALAAFAIMPAVPALAFTADRPAITNHTEHIMYAVSATAELPPMSIMAASVSSYVPDVTTVAGAGRSCKPLGGAYLVPVDGPMTPGSRALAVPWCRPSQ